MRGDTFRGLSAAIGSIVPYMGLFFTSYEFFHQKLGGKTLPFGSGDAAAGVMASVLAKTFTFPLDLVRKRLQVQGAVEGEVCSYQYTGLQRRVEGLVCYMEEGRSERLVSRVDCKLNQGE